MKKQTTTITIILTVLITTITLFAQSADKPAAYQSEISVRELPAQTVLYTIVRGPYKNTGRATSKLFAVLGQNGIRPMGFPTYTYLNNPKIVPSEHWLTEIRIPVGDDATKLAGTLGEMTDVKKIPAMKVAVIVKLEGMSEPATIYEKLGKWLLKENYIAIESPTELILTNAMAGDYSQMKSEIMMPIVRAGLREEHTP
jgi:effector-binding domain-containing protein